MSEVHGSELHTVALHRTPAGCIAFMELGDGRVARPYIVMLLARKHAGDPCEVPAWFAEYLPFHYADYWVDRVYDIGPRGPRRVPLETLKPRIT